MAEAIFLAPPKKRLDGHKVNKTRLKNVAHNVRRIECHESMNDIIPH